MLWPLARWLSRPLARWCWVGRYGASLVVSVLVSVCACESVFVPVVLVVRACVGVGVCVSVSVCVCVSEYPSPLAQGSRIEIFPPALAWKLPNPLDWGASGGGVVEDEPWDLRVGLLRTDALHYRFTRLTAPEFLKDLRCAARHGTGLGGHPPKTASLSHRAIRYFSIDPSRHGLRGDNRAASSVVGA